MLLAGITTLVLSLLSESGWWPDGWFESGGKIGMPPLCAHFLEVTLLRLAAQWPRNDLQLDLAVYGLRDASLFGGVAKR